MNDKIPPMMKEMLLRNCNNQIEEFNEVVNHLSQYSVCTCLIVPKKYHERIVNELTLLKNDFNIPIAYEIKDFENDQISVALFNLGVIQKESILEGYK